MKFMKGLKMNDSNYTFTLDSSTPTSTITLDSNYAYDINSSWISDNIDTGLDVSGDLTVNGVDVMQTIKDMQRVLGVVGRDIAKEEKYAGLRRAAEAYERELAKINTFETIKDSN